jgi:acyl carrier protein
VDTQLIYQRLTTVFRDVFDDDSLMPTATMSAKDVPDWDSLNHVRLVVSVEAEFKVRFTAGEIAQLKNVGELVALIQRKV